MTDKSTEEPDLEIEQRVETLEAELAEMRKSEVIKDSIIQEYRQALDTAHLKIAILNGQLKVATKPTE